MRYLVLSIALFSFLLSASAANSLGDAMTPVKDETKKKGAASAFEFNSKDPIYITSDWMEFDQNKYHHYKDAWSRKAMTIRRESDGRLHSEMKQIKQIVAEESERDAG
jgi:hypothetical protein